MVPYVCNSVRSDGKVPDSCNPVFHLRLWDTGCSPDSRDCTCTELLKMKITSCKIYDSPNVCPFWTNRNEFLFFGGLPRDPVVNPRWCCGSRNIPGMPHRSPTLAVIPAMVREMVPVWNSPLVLHHGIASARKTYFGLKNRPLGVFDDILFFFHRAERGGHTLKGAGHMYIAQELYIIINVKYIY